MKPTALLFIFMTLVAMASSATYPLAGHTAAHTSLCTELSGVCKLQKLCYPKYNIELSNANGFNICKQSWIV